MIIVSGHWEQIAGVWYGQQQRFVATKAGWSAIRRRLVKLANARCEFCGAYTPLDKGHAHHVEKRKMGGGSRDDRIWVDGRRQLNWLCFSCHERAHS